jgi:hypothetical protein
VLERINFYGSTEISYLENRFCNLAMEAKRYEVKNGNDPTSGNVTEEKESELEEFIDYARIIMETLGIRYSFHLQKVNQLIPKIQPIIQKRFST